MATINIDKIDERIKSVSALTFFLFSLQLLKTTSGFFFPTIEDTIINMVDFYLPLTLLFLVGLLFHATYRTKALPPLPPAYQVLIRYVFWFVVFWIATFAFLYTGYFRFQFGLSTVSMTGVGSWILNLIVATMENLPLVMIAPVLFNFNLGGEGITGRIIEYIPAGILAAASHMSVYWVQTQLRIERMQAQGITVNPITSFITSLFIAFIAFTIFYLVYRKWGFAASVALHQTFNMNNTWLAGA